MAPNELWQISATDAVKALKQGEIQSAELIEAAIGRIEAVDDKVNALPIRCFERALEQAKAFDVSGLRGGPKSLGGLPIAVKDYNDVSGVRTTYGSPIYADYVPKNSDATIALLEARGAIPIAKSNVPEWAGGHTFNPVHGTTRNPWNTSRSAGGSSGGSAAALATGQAWLATGNDLGGSLRTPAGFNGVVGLRPSPGIVPRGKRLQPFDTLWVEGPMARSVADAALMLDAGAGHMPNDPLSFEPAGGSYVAALEQGALPKRIAFSTDLGIVPVAREVSDVTQAAVKKLAGLGIDMTDDIPDFTGVLDAFHTLRAVLFGTMMGELLETSRDRISEDIIGNIEHGFTVTPERLFQAERLRRDIAQRMSDFFETHDLLLCPSASILPFPIEQRFVTEIDGRPCRTYIDWFAVTFAITMTACPAISIPCGFTKDGLPVGLQIVGRPRGEATLLRAAQHLEQVFATTEKLPIDPREGTPNEVDFS